MSPTTVLSDVDHRLLLNAPRSGLFIIYRIWAEESLQRAVQINEEVSRNPALPSENTEAFMSALVALQANAIATIVFSAMAAEAFINDYGARKLGQGFFEKNLDRLDVVSKWVVTTRLTTSREMKRGGTALQMLDALAAQRNKLVHYKSKEASAGASHESVDLDLLSRAEDAVSTLDLLASEIDKIDPQAGAAFLIGPQRSLVSPTRHRVTFVYGKRTKPAKGPRRRSR